MTKRILSSIDLAAEVKAGGVITGTANLYLKSNGPGTAPSWATAVATAAQTFVIKANTGSSEGIDLYTYDGSAAKVINFTAGTNLSIAATSNTFAFNPSTTPALTSLTTTGTINLQYTDWTYLVNNFK
jgi:hypothetical protein